MSEELIKKSDAIKALDAKFTIKGKENMQTVLNYLELVRTRIEGAPTIEPKRGEWIDVWQDGVCSWRGTCSVCRSTNDIPPPFEANYCPNCGAKMKGADDE